MTKQGCREASGKVAMEEAAGLCLGTSLKETLLLVGDSAGGTEHLKWVS